MNINVYVIATLAIVISITISLFVLYRLHNNTNNKPRVFCIMVTGKDDQRLCFSQKSIDNFNEQLYENKTLIIINHNSKKVLQHSPRIEENIFEFQIQKEKNNLTLGDLRNIALQLVPIDALWTVWDDDDYRTPDYLDILTNEMEKTSADVVVFTHRIECNYNTGFVWEMELGTGFVFVLAKQDLRVKYKNLNTMEDVDLIKDFRKLGKHIHVFNNRDKSDMYIRLVHGTNTSLYVDKDKTAIHVSCEKNIGPYVEKSLPQGKQKEILHFISEYYSKCLIFQNNNS